MSIDKNGVAVPAGNNDVYDLLQEREFHDRLIAKDVDYRVLGGIGIQAVLTAEQINPAVKEIVLSPDAELSVIRENGTRRDIDMLICTSDREWIMEAKDIVTDAVGKELSVSVFGLRDRVNGPRRWDFLTQRYIDKDSGDVFMRCDNIEEKLPESFLEPWVVKSSQLNPVAQVISPAAQLVSYKTRSITGIRHKDREKVDRLSGLLAENLGLDVEMDSVRKGVTQDELEDMQKQLDTGAKYYREIARRRNSVLSWMGAKASVLAALESNATIIELGQGRLEGFLSRFIGRY